MSALSDFVYALALSPWALIVLALLLIIDGFFPLVPGETTVVALATLGASGHGPAPLTVLLVGIAATLVGDGIAFLIGRKLGLTRWKWGRRPKVVRALAWATGRIADRPGLILIIAKFLPYARVAITMTAGASGLAVRRYLLFSLLAASIYTLYHIGVATTFGTLFASNPLTGLLVSIGFGLAIAGISAGTRALLQRSRTKAKTTTTTP
ncbi:VTT domain-containing protein [Glaciihabitans sp. UYNi722]|uniref:DedA family protein n=1 Tax=Glaciihabitans sp. UYNi722 TaxID=3156344 RepID=UPI003398F135